MRIPRSIHDNLRFLTAGVGPQVANVQGCFETGSVTITHRTLDRSGYAYHLKTRIHSTAS